MPNWTKNHITIHGPVASLQRIITECCADWGVDPHSGEPNGVNLDFAKIVPYPEGFDRNLPSGSNDVALHVYRLRNGGTGDELVRMLGWPWVVADGITTVEDLAALLEKRWAERGEAIKARKAAHKADPTASKWGEWDEEELALHERYPTFMDLGAGYARNIELTGCLTWYGFNTHYWGTKWNVCDPYPYEFHQKGRASRLIFQFNTAWCEPAGVLQALANKYGVRIVDRCRHEDGNVFERIEFTPNTAEAA